MTEPESRPKRLLLAVGLFLIVWGSKLVLIERFGSDVPQWDQWDAEGANLILAHEQERLAWRDFFAPHNEHRIACTRLLALGLFLLNGQWDPRLECVVNAALHSLIVVLVFFWGCRGLDRRWHGAWLALLAGVTALPLAWENVISGFHSQQYFLIGLSLATLALLGTAAVGSLRWWIGVACGVAALFTMASGLLAAAAIGGVLLATIRTRHDLRTHGMTLLACALIVALGALLQVPTLAQHQALHADSVAEFAAALSRYVQWPYERLFWLRITSPVLVLPAIGMWIPWLWLGVRVWKRRTASSKERVIFAAGLWVLLQIAASALMRGSGAPQPAMRYINTLLVGIAVNALALTLLFSIGPARVRPLRPLRNTALLAFGIALTGLGIHGVHFSLYELPRRGELLREWTATMQAYLQTDDVAILESRPIPHPRPADLVERLSHPELRAVLPASLQPPTVRPAPLSRLARSFAHAGFPIAVFGLLTLLAGRTRLARPPHESHS